MKITDDSYTTITALADDDKIVVAKTAGVKKITFATLKALLKTYFDTVYSALWSKDAGSGDLSYTANGVKAVTIVEAGAVVNAMTVKGKCIGNRTNNPTAMVHTDLAPDTWYDDQGTKIGWGLFSGAAKVIAMFMGGGYQGIFANSITAAGSGGFQFRTGGLTPTQNRYYITSEGRHLFGNPADDVTHLAQFKGPVIVYALTTAVEPVVYTASLVLSYLAAANKSITLTGNISIELTSVYAGGEGIIYLTQDATGSRLLTALTHAGLTVKFKGGVNTLSTTANTIDMIRYNRFGTILLIEIVKGF